MEGRVGFALAGLAAALACGVALVMRIPSAREARAGSLDEPSPPSVPAPRAPELVEPEVPPATRVALRPTPARVPAPKRVAQRIDVHEVEEDPVALAPKAPPAPKLWLSARVATADGEPTPAAEVSIETCCAFGCSGGTAATRTDSEGAFRTLVASTAHTAYPPPHRDASRACALLTVNAQGHLPLVRSVVLDERGGEIDLGLLTLPEGGAVVGVARAGCAPRDPAAWCVTVMPSDPSLPSFLQRKASGLTPDAAGGFTTDGLAPGLAIVRVHHFELGLLEEHALEVREGETVTVELDYAGGDPSRILVVSTPPWAVLAPGDAWLSGFAAIQPRGVFEGRLVFDDLEDRLYELTLLLPGGQAARVPDLRPGGCVPVSYDRGGTEAKRVKWAKEPELRTLTPAEALRAVRLPSAGR